MLFVRLLSGKSSIGLLAYQLLNTNMASLLPNFYFKSITNLLASSSRISVYSLRILRKLIILTFVSYALPVHI